MIDNMYIYVTLIVNDKCIYLISVIKFGIHTFLLFIIYECDK